jgi:hypothetical protein
LVRTINLTKNNNNFEKNNFEKRKLNRFAFIITLFTIDMYSAKTLPEQSTMEQGRKSDVIYTVFCSRFLQGVIGNSVFKTGCCTMNLTDYCSASDEAMTFLILANNWQPWLKIAEMKKRDPKAKLEDCGVKQLYFKDTKGRGHSWSNEGKMYYNEMYDRVLEDRKENGKDFDEFFLNYMKQNSDEGKRLEKHKKKERVEATPVIKCKRDLPPIMEGTNISNHNVSGYVSKGTKKQRCELSDEETAIEQARRAGATNIALM